MTLNAAVVPAQAPAILTTERLSTRWLVRTVAVLLFFWAAAVGLPQVLGLSGPWRAFGAGLVVPGAGLLYAIPGMQHPIGITMVVGHAILVAIEAVTAAWVLRKLGWLPAVCATLVCVALIVGCFVAPYAVVVSGHVAAFVGVVLACGWAFGIRLIARADSVTLVAIITVSAAAGGGLTAWHGGRPGPMTWIPWAALAIAIGGVCASSTRAWTARRSARRLGEARMQYLNPLRRSQNTPAQASAVGLERSVAIPEVTEASADQLRLLRYLIGVASQPVDDWDSFDDEAQGPLQQYRYQVNALGWALAMYNYSHTPAYSGVLTTAQVALLERAQQKAVWGYWYWQNLLGNWDFRKRRADPIDIPQNIMFSGYLNLQLAMFRQATGDSRFELPGSLVFNWSPRQRFSFDHQQINTICIRNFNQDLYLWPCEPVLSPGRKRGYVFPYCNTVTTAGIAIMDTVNATNYGSSIANNVAGVLEREYTRAANDMAAFVVSGLGLSVRRVMSGTGSTAGVAAFIAPLCPELGWRAWEILKREWLETDLFREPSSTGREMPDWSTGAKTNAETLAAAMHLAHTVGDEAWHATLWDAAVEQLHFTGQPTNPGVASFEAASVHANGMLGLGGLSRPLAFNDMLTKPRPTAWDNGPQLVEAPHPEVLVAKAVSDGHGLDLVLQPGIADGRVGLSLDCLRPFGRYVIHGAVESHLTADGHGRAELTADIMGRTTIELRPL